MTVIDDNQQENQNNTFDNHCESLWSSRVSEQWNLQEDHERNPVYSVGAGGTLWSRKAGTKEVGCVKCPVGVSF